MIDYLILSDEELISLFENEDHEALEVLTGRYMEKAQIIAGTLSVPSSEISDLVQEGMIGFLSAVYSYDKNKQTSFSTFASACIKNRMLSELRKSAAKRKIPKELIVSYDEQSQNLISHMTPEQYLISEKNSNDIVMAIEALTEREAMTFKLHLAGFSYDEISERLSVTTKAVDSALQRARKKLRKTLSL